MIHGEYRRYIDIECYSHIYRMIHGGGCRREQAWCGTAVLVLLCHKAGSGISVVVEVGPVERVVTGQATYIPCVQG